MKKSEQLAILFAEKHGIINYKLKGYKMTYYRRYKIDVFGHYQTTKFVINLRTNDQTTTVLKRNRKTAFNPL